MLHGVDVAAVETTGVQAGEFREALSSEVRSCREAVL